MRADQEAIKGVPIVPSAAQARLLANQKAKEEKISKTHNFIDPSYQAMHVPEKDPICHVDGVIQEPINFFNKYFTPVALNQLATWTNQNDATQLPHFEAHPKKHTRKGPVKIREWDPVSCHDMRVFLGVLILSGQSSLWATDQYWNTEPEYAMEHAVYESMPQRRFEQIK